MHQMGFKIVDTFREMTRRQKVFFQQGYIYEQEKIKEGLENRKKYKDVDGYEKAKEVVRRKKTDGSDGSNSKSSR